MAKKKIGYGETNIEYPYILRMDEKTFRLRVRQNNNDVYGEKGALRAFSSFIGKRCRTEKQGVPQAGH